MTKKEHLDKFGWILIKNVFDEKEIKNFREYADKDKDHKGDLLSSNSLSKVITETRIIDLMKDCLGSKELFYFGDSTFTIDSKGSGFHKDSRDRKKKNSKEYKDIDYSLLRLGVYLQDHTSHSKGLCLRSKSHLYQSVHKGKIINVKSEVGDVVVWKLTTTHSANAGIISSIPNIPFHPFITKFIPDFLKQPYISPRMALFATFGLEDDYSKLYIEYFKTRAYAVNVMKNSQYHKDNISKMENEGVKVLKDFDLDSIDMDNLNDKFVQI